MTLANGQRLVVQAAIIDIGETPKHLSKNDTRYGNCFELGASVFWHQRMDVEILRRACLQFRKIMLDLAGVDPFVQATTIASACSYMFRKKYLKENTIALIPPEGYRRCDTHSQIAIEWLLLCEHELRREIIHTGRSREHCLIEGYRVDGYLGPTDGSPRGTVFEFQGCFFHGCLKCYPSGRDRAMFNNRALNESYERTKVKIDRLKALGYTYKVAENISLDPDKVEKNPARRAFSKLALNSFWGKFSQRGCLSQTSVIKSRKDLLELLKSPDKETHDIVLVSDETIYAQWKYKQEAENATCYTNVVIAAYTTAQARLVLYEYLEQLDRRVLYCDTNSVIYTSAAGEYEPPLGTALGAMTDELESYGKDTYIRSFVSGGPKFYAYEAYTPGTGELHRCCKIKGISLNHENSKKINYESVKRMILRLYDDDDECEDNSITVDFRAIRRTKTHDIVSRDESKRCCPVLKKRRFIDSEFSLPFGYKDSL
uniref:DNA-directed DNA polymerase n=1 Tax=Trichogramma kaykai TaxID=54128 RepID=A0ABD2VT53_9HYME